MNAGGSCSALDDAKAILSYSIVLRPTGRQKFPSYSVIVPHIHERLPNEPTAFIRAGCPYFPMVP